MEDSEFYVQAISEFQSGDGKPALLAKAYALAKGDAKAQEFEYISLRVAQLRTAHVRATASGVAGTAKAEARRWWPLVRKILLWGVALYACLVVIVLIVAVANGERIF